MKSNYKPIGRYVRLVKLRNKDLAITDLKGINIDKQFMPSVANVTGTDLSKYKIVSQFQFAFNPMHVGRDEVLPISMLTSENPVIVSPAYTVFEIKNHQELLPEYLMMWCQRSEFDRNAWFTTDSSVRGGFSWEDFCEMPIPVPSIEKQKEIVCEYNTIVERIKLNEQLCQKLEETAQALYKQWFVDFEFPISKEYAESMGKPELEGKPYQSSGGKMIYDNELQQNIPYNWKSGKLLDLFELQRGFDLPIQDRKSGNVKIYAANGPSDFHDKSKVRGPGVITGRSGTLGEVFYAFDSFWPLNTTLWVKNFNISEPFHAYFTLKNINILEYNCGSAVPTLNRNYLHMHKISLPTKLLVHRFDSLALKLFDSKRILETEFSSLKSLTNILHTKMSKGS